MKGKKVTDRQANNVLVFLLMIISAFTFALIVWRNYPDIPDHNRFITRWLSGDYNVKLYSLYYFVILVLSFFQNHTGLINIISIALLTFAVTAKFLVANFIFKREFPDEVLESDKRYNIGFAGFGIKGIIALCVFFICIAENLIYKPSATMALGYLPVNTWHNSTTIFLMPFAIWLFYKSYLFICNHRQISNIYNKLLELLLLTVFCVFIKPSYFFVFAIAFPLYYLLRFGINKNLFLTGMVSVLSTFALLLVYRYVYTGSDSSVTISPFHVWGYWSGNIPVSLLASVFFPLLFAIIYFKETVQDHLLSYAWINMLVAIMIYILLTETGGREMHGNFGWQTIICNFILFLCTWILFLRLIIRKQELEMKDKVLITSFVFHIATGAVFLLKLPLYGAR